MQLLNSARRWLVHCVIDHHGVDRPFRLRRVSLLLLSAGWIGFLTALLIGQWITGHDLPLFTLHEVLHGIMHTRNAVLDPLPEAQQHLFIAAFWVMHALQWVGASLFFAGLASVALFDQRDATDVCQVR